MPLVRHRPNFQFITLNVSLGFIPELGTQLRDIFPEDADPEASGTGPFLHLQLRRLTSLDEQLEERSKAH